MGVLEQRVAELGDAVAVADPHDCALIAASLRRGRAGSESFEHDPHVYFALLRALEARAGEDPRPPAAGAVVIEHPSRRVGRVVEGQGSPRRRVLVESPHYVKPPRS